MAGNLLISGPAGSDKSRLARERLEQHSGLIVAADFQAIYAALTLAERDRDGLYPPRIEALLPLAEYTRRAVITAASARDIAIVATNSDGSPERRRLMLEWLGPDAEEEIIDPGEDVVRARLSNRRTGRLSRDCEKALGRWYLRGGRGGGGRRR